MVLPDPFEARFYQGEDNATFRLIAKIMSQNIIIGYNCIYAAHNHVCSPYSIGF